MLIQTLSSSNDIKTDLSELTKTSIRYASFTIHSSATGGQIIYYLQKRLNWLEGNSFLVFNDFSKYSSLISTFAWPADYKKRESHCKRPCFTYACSNQGVKYWLSYSKYRVEIEKIKMFQNQSVRFQNISKRTQKKTWMFKYFKFSNYYGCQIYQISAQRRIKSLIVCGND